MTMQYDTCDSCRIADEVIMSGGMSLCQGCRAERCPACGEFTGTYWEEHERMVCETCGQMYLYVGD